MVTFNSSKLFAAKENTMPTITEETINQVYTECLEHASSIYPFAEWNVIPKGYDIESPKRRYAEVSPEGIVSLSKSFLGTESINKLKETIYHEFAHLKVGLDQNHNKRFQAAFSRLKGELTVDKSENQSIKDNNGYPLRLIAHGQKHTYDAGGAFRRTKKWTEYGKDGKLTMSIRGDTIERFEYITYDSPLPESIIRE